MHSERKSKIIPKRKGVTQIEWENFRVAAIRIPCPDDQPLARPFSSCDDSHCGPVQEDRTVRREVGMLCVHQKFCAKMKSIGKNEAAENLKLKFISIYNIRTYKYISYSFTFGKLTSLINDSYLIEASDNQERVIWLTLNDDSVWPIQQDLDMKIWLK